MPIGGTKHGRYSVINKQKCINSLSGAQFLSYKSSYEQRLMYYFDRATKIRKWGYEVVSIPYISAVDGRQHTYYTDFYVEFNDENGKLIRSVIEVKPYSETLVPKITKRKKKATCVMEATTYAVNRSKWDAAEAWCRHNNMTFTIITEKDIFNR